jgi:hypothetical protein
MGNKSKRGKDADHHKTTRSSNKEKWNKLNANNELKSPEFQHQIDRNLEDKGKRKKKWNLKSTFLAMLGRRSES